MNDLKLNQAILEIWSLIRESNRFIEAEQPWVLAKTNKKRLERDMYILLETLRNLAWMLWPIVPKTAENIWLQLGLKSEKKLEYKNAQKWGGLKSGKKIKKGDPLFPKI